MEIGNIVSWIQLGVWVLAVVYWIARIMTGKTQMHPLVKKTLSSNLLMGIIVILGLGLSVMSLYLNRRQIQPQPAQTQSAVPDWSKYIPTKIVSGQTFRNETVVLDYIEYDDCTFYNVTLEYDGATPIRLSDNSFHGVLFHSKNPGIDGMLYMLASFHLLSKNTQIYGPAGKGNMTVNP